MTRALFSAALFGAAAQALQFSPAHTQVVGGEAAEEVALPAPTSPPELRRMNKRDTFETMYFAPDNTCGFLTGDADIAYTCNNVDAQCAITTVNARSGYIGCCDDGSCGGFHLTCIDSADYYTGTACGTRCKADTSTLKCSNTDAPYCNSVSINAAGNLKVYGYYCNDEVTASYQPIYTSFDGETDGRGFTVSVLTVRDSGTATFPDNSAVITVPDSTTPPTPGPTAPTPPPSTPTPAPKKSNTGAIAGGVVGGVAGLAIIGAIIFYLLRRQRKDVGTQPPPAAPPPQDPALGAAAAGTPSPGPNMYGAAVPPYAPASPTKYDYQQGGGISPQMSQQPYPGQPGGYQPYYPAAAAGGMMAASALSPDRTGSASPMQPGQDYRMSSVSAADSSPYTGPISPQSTGNTAVMLGGVPGQPQVPATIHEAGGNTVGASDYNANHRGEMHELA